MEEGFRLEPGSSLLSVDRRVVKLWSKWNLVGGVYGWSETSADLMTDGVVQHEGHSFQFGIIGF